MPVSTTPPSTSSPLPLLPPQAARAVKRDKKETDRCFMACTRNTHPVWEVFLARPKPSDVLADRCSSAAPAGSETRAQLDGSRRGVSRSGAAAAGRLLRARARGFLDADQ